MKSILTWVILIIYFGVILYLLKNYNFLGKLYDNILLIVKNQSVSKVIFTTIVIIIPDGMFLYLVNHKWKK